MRSARDLPDGRLAVPIGPRAPLDQTEFRMEPGDGGYRDRIAPDVADPSGDAVANAIEDQSGDVDLLEGQRKVIGVRQAAMNRDANRMGSQRSRGRIDHDRPGMGA